MEKQKFHIEYEFNSSPKVLYNRLATPSGLAEWFADDVNFENGMQTYIFAWGKEQSKAHIISKKEPVYIRYSWEHEDDDIYFEFKIHVDELTKDVLLEITDFAEADEVDDAIQLWNKQIENLKHVVGS
ncbi:MAG TPA: START-like domain-containing protein [Bacteroidales bacterium]|jgi:uncharacterized protein YndB with AHSA1/START domain|nr:START-like domain-containing protein [Bacteroidales bacterium]